ncbi:hypothetical protein POTG_00054 [Paenibacillus sp. oral taxon 786 str. D14]|uniref:hypothetical protein n=1 Tax=Paenibacillus sp. oral taxon 786 TaxID=652715 RepID=UPI0001AFD220|nr:hypothetical protein [Paenibacillus sp. oral taxon 786]EES74823.1 hypothetical protein POTG_00054 [Paenibacillus sp. oral taxon 786 str. D14]
MIEGFVYDERLDIHVPMLERPFDEYELDERLAMIAYWEEVRGRIPTKVMVLEQSIEHMLNEMNEETDFERSCRLNGEIAELASRINDLLIWYRTVQEEPSAKRHM